MLQDPKPTLKTTPIGSGEHRAVFLHGLFGRGKNFTTLPGAAARVQLPARGPANHGLRVDGVLRLRRHGGHRGQQPRADFAAAGPVDVVGHSMGGKVAMARPATWELARRLVVEDIAPVDSQEADTTSRGNFEHLLGSPQAPGPHPHYHRSQADAALRAAIPDDTVRGVSSAEPPPPERRLRLQPNLDLLHSELGDIGGVAGGRRRGAHQTGPVLWVAGRTRPTSG
ncbi:alpha/beta hydrolase [Kocuria rhizophila]|nr:alpha/beta hydrolase [Kocuria rhizophila]